MPRSLTLLLALSLAVPDLASTQSQERPVRAGTYDLAIVFGGGNLEATLDIGCKGVAPICVQRAWSPDLHN